MGESAVHVTDRGTTVLPPGQRSRADFPRFGLPQYAHRIPSDTESRLLNLGGDAIDTVLLDDGQLETVPRSELTSDFHCVTTWSHLGARWSGYRFVDVFHQLIAARVHPGKSIGLVVLRCRDGYRTALPLEDLLAEDVLVADSLGGAPLTVQHGAPLRLVAPAHYGYKSAKHLKGIELWENDRAYRKSGIGHYMDHPRARVAFEERARVVPGRLLRWIYRPMIGRNVRRFRIEVTTAVAP